MPLPSAHCDLSRTAPAPRATNLAQSDLKDCEQDLHKDCGAILPNGLILFRRCRLYSVACRCGCYRSPRWGYGGIAFTRTLNFSSQCEGHGSYHHYECKEKTSKPVHPC